jgi:outer membrane protein OmpA-like peptidoglycan-associated protein
VQPKVTAPTKPPAPPAPTTQPTANPPAAAPQQRDHRDDNRAHRPAPPQTPAARQQQQPPAPGQQQNPPAAATQQPAPRNNNPAAVPPPPVQRHDASEFMRRKGQAASPQLDQVKRERKETHEGNRTFIREGDRTIVREDNRVIIRHNESNRFSIGARNVRTERRGNNSETTIERGDGTRIIDVVDSEGRLLRRVRRDARGHEIVIIDDSRAARRSGPLFIQLPPPVIHIPRERYILDADRARPADIYGVLMEPPVEVIDQPYTLGQVRYSAPLRDRMPRVDLDINFDTASWQLTLDQIDRLSVIADAIKRAVQRRPDEVFMIEGYTDATGNEVDNLSLSDRRAEAVAVALTEQFGVPPANLVTQGYGEAFLKVPTNGPERANRRVAVRRITPLINAQAGGPPPPPPPR